MKIEGGGGGEEVDETGRYKREKQMEKMERRGGRGDEKKRRRWKQKQPGPNMMWIRYTRLILDIPGIQEAVQRCKCNQEGLN